MINLWTPRDIETIVNSAEFVDARIIGTKVDSAKFVDKG